MYSLYITEADESTIFEECFKGDQAKRTGRSGKGIGLYRSNRLIRSICHGELLLNPGPDRMKEDDGFDYANNDFIIVLPLKY